MSAPSSREPEEPFVGDKRSLSAYLVDSDAFRDAFRDPGIKSYERHELERLLEEIGRTARER